MALCCPRCGLWSPLESQRCDCGYDFDAHRVLGSYLTPQQQAQVAKEKQTQEEELSIIRMCLRFVLRGIFR